MTGSYLLLLAVGVVLASAAIAALWVIQLRIRAASHVDVGWAIGIAGLAVVYALLATAARGTGCSRRRSPRSGGGVSACISSSTACSARNG